MAVYQEIETVDSNGGVTVLLNQTAVFIIRSKNINWGEVGSIMAHCAASDGNAGFTGAKMVRYRKSNAGVLTLGTVVSVLPNVNDTGFTGANFSFQVGTDNNLEITFTPPSTQKELRVRMTFPIENGCSINSY